MKRNSIGPHRFRLWWIPCIALAVVWVIPLLYALWAAVHPSRYVTRFDFLAPLTLENFTYAWTFAPFPRYLLNTVIMVTSLLAGQFVVGSLAAFAFARYPFPGHKVAFGLVLAQLMITPEILIVENYGTLARLGLTDSIAGIVLPYMASAFGIFLLRQAFKSVPSDLDDAARIDGCNWAGILRHVYVPLTQATYLAWGLVSVSHHWNDFLWPLVVTNSVKTRPLTVGLAIFAAPESGVDWSVLSAGTLLSIAPLMLVYLVFQKQFTESFVMTGLK